MDAAGSNGPAIVNGGANNYDREVCFDAPVAMDTGLFVDPNEKTLAQLREQMMVRLGMAAMLASPPPGMVQELNSFLQDAQEQLYLEYAPMRTQRWWSWTLQPGSRFYDVPVDCTRYLDFRRITWAGVSDGATWLPLAQGIDPLAYSVDSPGTPTHFDIGQYIEVWPTPVTAGVLRLRGHMGLARFTEDTDTPTIDGHVVFLFALANAKAHRGHPDAGNYSSMARRMIANIVAGSHGVRRYIPRPSTAGLKLDPGPWAEAGTCGLPIGTWRA